MDVTKTQIEKVACPYGGYLPRKFGYREGWDMDGAEAARFLTAVGYKVVFYGNVGTHGRAVTECGLVLSTNGYCYRKPYGG